MIEILILKISKMYDILNKSIRKWSKFENFQIRPRGEAGSGTILRTRDPSLREPKSQDIGGNHVTSQIMIWEIIYVMPHYTYDVIIIICVVRLIKIDSVMIILTVTWDGFLRPVSPMVIAIKNHISYEYHQI